MVRLAAVAGLILTAGLAGAQPDADEAKEKRAELSAQSLVVACEAYYLNPQSGDKYPEKLDQLVTPPFGGFGFVRKATDLIDPWGKAYRYRVAPGADGSPQPFVWSEREVNGRTKVVGRKPPEPTKK
jgi:hypothetical protein